MATGGRTWLACGSGSGSRRHHGEEHIQLVPVVHQTLVNCISFLQHGVDVS